MAEWSATFRLKFSEEGSEFKLNFIDSEDFKTSFGEIIEVEHGYDPYGGPYIVTPKRYDQILATNGKNMEDDVTVLEVPWIEVSNPEGTTYIIASD